MNRAELVRRLAAHEAAAAALREALEGEAREELDANGTAPSWRLGDGTTVVVRTSKGGLFVTDEEAFVQWARQQYPGEFVEETTVKFRNPGFRKRLIEAWQEALDDENNETGLPDFLDREPQGLYRSTSITVAPATKTRMKESARLYVLAGRSMPELEAGS